MRKDGSRIRVLVGFTLSGASETVAFVLDISERKAAVCVIRRLNQDLERRAALLQTLFDVLPVGIGVAEDPSCRNIVVNPALAKILKDPGRGERLAHRPRRRPARYVQGLPGWPGTGPG